MRVSDSMNYTNTKLSLNKNRSEMSDLQSQAASQKKVNKPSDDPVGSAKLMASRTDVKSLEQYQKTLDNARTFLDFSDQALAEITDSLIRAKELALSQSNDPSSSEHTRKTVATEIRQLYNQSLQIANRKLGNRFIFGGYNTTSKPFENDGEYKGDRGEMLVEINKGAYLSMNLPGDIVFLGRDAKKSGVLSAPSDPSDLKELKQHQLNSKPSSQESQKANGGESIRGPASGVGEGDSAGEYNVFLEGENIFKVLSDLETGLVANDKGSIQDSLDRLDSSLDQIVHARAKVGARVQNLNSVLDSLQKLNVDEKAKQSAIEDVDAYELMSKLSQNESALQAVMSTSAKILQPSLLDFLR